MPYKDPEKRKAAFKKYYEKHKDKVLEKNRKWAEDNPDKISAINKRYYDKTIGIDVDFIGRDEIEDALDNLLEKPKPEPVPEPEPLTEEEVAEILKDFKR